MAKALVFDFDGTLVDSIGSIWEEYQRVMEAMNLKRVTHREFTRHIGRAWADVITSLWPGVDPKEFTSHYRLEAEVVKPIDGADMALEKLAEKYVLAIMSARGGETLNPHLRRMGYNLELFKAVYHRNNLKYNKPDPRAILQVCKRLKVKPGDVIYIGDSIVDAECALKAGAGFIAVLSGGAYPEDFREMGVTDIIGSVAELPSHLEERGH